MIQPDSQNETLAAVAQAIQDTGRPPHARRLELSLDPLSRMQDLEAVLSDLGEAAEDSDLYVIAVPRSVGVTEAPTQSAEQVYLPDGSLNCDFLIRNADLLFEAGDTALARNIYQTLLKAGEKVAVAHFGVGRCFEQEGNFKEALRSYEESVTYSPTKVAFRRWIKLLVKTDDHVRAAEAAGRALLMRSLDARTRAELHQVAGNCLARTQKLDQAEAHFLKGLECDPTSDELRANLGALYLQRGRIVDARRQFQDAIASHPSNAKAHEGLGSCYYAEKNFGSAHDSFATALEIEIQNPHAIFYLIKCAYELKSYAAAARLGEQYIQVAPVNAHLLYSVAGLHFHLGKLPEARTLTDRALQIQPQHAGARELRELMDAYGHSQEGKWQQI